jgi:hypothetical protein
MTDRQTPAEVFAELKRGDQILIKFGTHNTQFGTVYGRTPYRVMVLKWRKRSRTWTKQVRLHEADLIRRARPGEMITDPIPFDIWSGKL